MQEADAPNSENKNTQLLAGSTGLNERTEADTVFLAKCQAKYEGFGHFDSQEKRQLLSRNSLRTFLDLVICCETGSPLKYLKTTLNTN